MATMAMGSSASGGERLDRLGPGDAPELLEQVPGETA